ncbi:phasin family protein [Roseovarius sp. S1116L3]|uniref:phasin family protein n=1 Tax=Roseovarius roseus TaxID=3342636 RepID=UPI003729C87C
MTKNDKTEKIETPATAMTDLLKNMQTSGMQAMPGVGTNWMEAMSDLGSEMLSFTAERIRQDVQMQHDLLHAKGISEIQHIHAQFFQKAMDDYVAETAKLMQMGQAFAPKTDKGDDGDKGGK